jgi:hypothetical protein
MKPINDIPLPCPFCGDMPYIDSDPDSCGITIECLSKGCVNPSLYMDHDHQDVTEIAVAHWNQRPPAEPAATAAPVAAPRQEEIDRLTAERDEARAALVKATSEPQTISWQTMRSMREESQATAERLRAALVDIATIMDGRDACEWCNADFVECDHAPRCAVVIARDAIGSDGPRPAAAAPPSPEGITDAEVDAIADVLGRTLPGLHPVTGPEIRAAARAVAKYVRQAGRAPAPPPTPEGTPDDL